MILPTKYINSEQALIGVGALLLDNLQEPINLSNLWELVRKYPNIGTFERFLLALDMLFILRAVILKDGKLKRADYVT